MNSPVSEISQLVASVIANSDADLTLNGLSDLTGVPAFKLHRHIKSVTGLTPARLIQHMRITQAAHDLVLQEASTGEISDRYGYQNLATFTRAFKRETGVTPREFRSTGRLSLSKTRTISTSGNFQIGKSRFQLLRPRAYLAEQYVGNYETVPLELWSDLMIRSQREKLAPIAMIGIGLDNPRIVDADQCRFIAGVIVDRKPKSAYETLDPGPWIVTRYAGPYVRMTEAIGEIAMQSQQVPGFELTGGPLMEVYHTLDMANDRPVEYTDLYFPAQTQNR